MCACVWACGHVRVCWVRLYVSLCAFVCTFVHVRVRVVAPMQERVLHDCV